MNPPANKDLMRSLTGLAAIFLVVIFCAWPGMQSPLFTDDVHQLERSMYLKKWTEIFQPDAFSFFRPVKNLMFMLAAPLVKNLVAWHWIGLIAYLAATAGIYRIASICLGKGRPALLATAFWALSPSCVSTVIWVSCANISIGIAMAACVFHFHESWATTFSKRALIGSVFFYACSLLCYESMIAIPGLLFIRDLQQKRLGFDRQSVTRYAVYTLVAIIFLVIRSWCSAKSIGDHNFHPGFAPDTTPLQLSLSAPWFLWRHFLMWIFPFGNIELLGSYAWLRSAPAASLIFAWGFLAGLLAAAACLWKRIPAVAYGILVFVVASLPAGNFIPNFNGPINDAYVTIPSIGLALAFAAVCEMAIIESAKRHRLLQSGAVIIAAVLGIFLLYRIPICGAYFRYWAGVWKNPIELMLLSSETRAYQFQPKAYLSVLLFSGGYIDEAEKISNEVVKEAPWNATARLTLARINEFRGNRPAAEEYFRFVLKSSGESAFLREPAMLELAKMISEDPSRREEAAALFREYIKTARPNHRPEAIMRLAVIYKDKGDLAKARSTLERGISLHPHESALSKMLDSLAAVPQQQ